MTLLPRYVSRSVLAAMVIVLLLLLGLDMVFAFIAELEDLRGNYRSPQALVYIVLTAPRRAYDLLPIAALVGGIVGLGMLANHSELTVMRAAGVSIRRLVWWVLKPALLLVLLGLVLGQWVVPQAEQLAEARRAEAMGRELQAGYLRSYWHREGDDILRIGRVAPGGHLQEVSLYHFAPDGRLLAARRALTASFADGHWQLQDVTATVLAPDGTASVTQAETQAWNSRLTPEFLRLVTLRPEYLSLSRLHEYAGYLRDQGLNAEVYFLEFWKKALAPLATISMVLIACSFIFGPLRSVTMGLRILAGIFAGLLFRYGQDFLGYASLVYDFSPVVAAGLPIAVCLLLGGVAVARVR
ncbi:MAG: LPS export ABC transporter permease LptG [Moraxellaceae bacterium]|nr:LPS export ABC transporter permease LptG [Moraxellaceae bacterium]